MRQQVVSATRSGTKPFLRWAGSKRQLVPRLLEYWQDRYQRYIEPFAGSAALFFALSPKRAILGDMNADLIEAYHQVRDNLQAVLVALREIEHGKRHYLRIRSIDPSLLSPPERAARFVYLNRYCFNGLYRTNRSGQFNVPYGGHKAGRIPSEDHFRKCSDLLQGAELVTGSFETVLSKVQRGDFVYMDPPFKVSARRVFNEYDASAFSQDDLETLRDWMVRLDEQDIPFAVSYAESEEADFLLRGFFSQLVTVRRNIAGFAGNRKSANELLISNHAIAAEVSDESQAP